MTLHTIQVKVELTEINCGCCGGTYAINERYREKQYEEGGSWNCPYCKVGWGYRNDNENSKLKNKLAKAERQIERERKEKEWAQQEAKNSENRRRGEKAAKTRIKNRIANGVCPCCNRTFKNLANHMTNKHPEYKNEDN